MLYPKHQHPRSTRRNGILVCFILIALCSGGCDRKSSPPPQRPKPQVSFVAMHTETVMLSSKLPGRTAALRVAEIRPQVSGLVQQRLFIEGARVEAGQVLYQIDPAPFEAALNNAKATLARAEANLPSLKSRVERYREMVAVKAVSQQNYDDAVAALNQVNADIEYANSLVEMAQINLGYTKVVAPISGRIGKSNVTDGAIVTAYQPIALAKIQQFNPIYVDIPQATADLLRLKRRLQDGHLQHGTDQNEVQLILEDGSSYPEKGLLQFSDVSVDPTTGSVILRAIFPNPHGVLLPGMFVQTTINEGVNKQALLVPQQAVMRDPKGKPYALVVDDDSNAGFRPLVLDRAIGDKWLVVSGLSVGDKVIVEGLVMLRPGTQVQASPFQPATATK